MSEEVKIKMLEVAKILFLNGVSKEQSKYIGSFIEDQNAEIERLNNIINELEKYIANKMNSFGVCNASDIYYKLQELKGSDEE